MNFLTLWSAVVFVVCSLLWVIVVKSSPLAEEEKYFQSDKNRYLKLNKLGQPVDAKMGPWHCILDTETDLLWEVKSPQEDIHYRKSMYSWYDGKTGRKGTGTCHSGEALYGCDSLDLISVSRQQNYCGVNNWRLPKAQELQSILYPLAHEGRARTNRWLFPRTYRGSYWTSEIDSVNDGEVSVTTVNFSTGNIDSLEVTKVAALRLVASVKE